MKALKTLRLFASTTADVFFLLQGKRSHAYAPDSVLARQAERKGGMRVETQTLANGIFDVLANSCPYFAALVVDTRAYFDGNEPVGGSPRFGYLRSQPVGLAKRASVGVPTAPHMIKYHEPCSEILDEGFAPLEW